MKVAAAVIQNLIRLLGVFQIVLGFTFWSGSAWNLIRLHSRTGEALVALLWILSLLALFAKIRPMLPVLGLAWGVLTVGYGMTMFRYHPGSDYWPLQVLHLLIGLIAIGLAEMISGRIKRSSPEGDLT